jgi:hypothetical protein
VVKEIGAVQIHAFSSGRQQVAYEHTFHLKAYPPGSNNYWKSYPVFPHEVKKIAGTYRLVLKIERDDTSLLPLEERISNEFKLIE